MKFTRHANVQWEGTGKEGKGHITTETKTLDNAFYAFKTRFNQEAGTNPEELLGAAHASCFTMQLSFLITEKGFTPEKLQTKASVTFEDGAITYVALELEGKVDGMTEADFNESAQKAKEICPVSKLFNTTITLKTTFIK
jgi:osmotically inducible protein OsmC